MKLGTALKRIGLACLLTIGTVGPALAIDCWVPTLDQATTGYGDKISSPRHANILAKMRKAEELFRNDRALLDLPTVRLQVKNFIGLPVYESGHTYSTTSVGMHRTKVWGPGCTLKQKQADYVVPIEFSANFNDISPVIHLLATPAMAQEAGFFPEPEKTGNVQGYPIYSSRVLVITPPGVPLLVPHRVEDHLRYWEHTFAGMLKESPDDPLVKSQLSDLRRHRAGLSPKQLGTQVALGAATEGAAGAMWAYSTLGTPSTVPAVKVNSSLWRPAAGQGQVRLLVLSAWVNDEDDALVEAAQRWVGSVDARSWASLLDL